MTEVTREQVKEYIKSMTLMDAAALVKELEGELGVSAAAPVAVAAAQAGPAAAQEEKAGEGYPARRPDRARAGIDVGDVESDLAGGEVQDPKGGDEKET